MLKRCCLQCSFGHVAGGTESGDNCHGMDFLIDELFCLFEQLPGQYHNRCGSISHFIVLDLGDVDEHFGGWIVDVDRFQYRRAIVGHRHRFSASSALQNLVLHRKEKLCLDDISTTTLPFLLARVWS